MKINSKLLLTTATALYLFSHSAVATDMKGFPNGPHVSAQRKSAAVVPPEQRLQSGKDAPKAAVALTSPAADALSVGSEGLLVIPGAGADLPPSLSPILAAPQALSRGVKRQINKLPRSMNKRARKNAVKGLIEQDRAKQRRKATSQPALQERPNAAVSSAVTQGTHLKPKASPEPIPQAVVPRPAVAAPEGEWPIGGITIDTVFLPLPPMLQEYREEITRFTPLPPELVGLILSYRPDLKPLTMKEYQKRGALFMLKNANKHLRDGDCFPSTGSGGPIVEDLASSPVGREPGARRIIRGRSIMLYTHTGAPDDNLVVNFLYADSGLISPESSDWFRFQGHIYLLSYHNLLNYIVFVKERPTIYDPWDTILLEKEGVKKWFEEHMSRDDEFCLLTDNNAIRYELNGRIDGTIDTQIDIGWKASSQMNFDVMWKHLAEFARNHTRAQAINVGHTVKVVNPTSSHSSIDHERGGEELSFFMSHGIDKWPSRMMEHSKDPKSKTVEFTRQYLYLLRTHTTLPPHPFPTQSPKAEQAPHNHEASTVWECLCQVCVKSKKAALAAHSTSAAAPAGPSITAAANQAMRASPGSSASSASSSVSLASSRASSSSPAKSISPAAVLAFPLDPQPPLVGLQHAGPVATASQAAARVHTATPTSFGVVMSFAAGASSASSFVSLAASRASSSSPAKSISPAAVIAFPLEPQPPLVGLQHAGPVATASQAAARVHTATQTSFGVVMSFAAGASSAPSSVSLTSSRASSSSSAKSSSPTVAAAPLADPSVVGDEPAYTAPNKTESKKEDS
jgi:hypothetical protein